MICKRSFIGGKQSQGSQNPGNDESGLSFSLSLTHLELLLPNAFHHEFLADCTLNGQSELRCVGLRC